MTLNAASQVAQSRREIAAMHITHSPLSFAKPYEPRIVAYIVTDHVSGRKRTFKDKRRARSFSDRRDNEYGAAITSIYAVWSDEVRGRR